MSSDESSAWLTMRRTAASSSKLGSQSACLNSPTINSPQLTSWSQCATQVMSLAQYDPGAQLNNRRDARGALLSDLNCHKNDVHIVTVLQADGKFESSFGIPSTLVGGLNSQPGVVV